MGREKYRHRILILRRPGEAESAGGYDEDVYLPAGETSCRVRDETEIEYASAESARIAHVRTFEMRIRDIRDDDLIVFQGGAYRVRRVDYVLNDAREIRVRAALTKSKYSVRG